MKRIFYLLKQSLFVKLALVTALVVGGENAAWGNLIDNGDGTFTENFVGYSRKYSNGVYNITAPTGWYAYPSGVSYSYNANGTTNGSYHTTSPSIYTSASNNTSNYIITPVITGNFKLWVKRYGSTSPFVSAYQCSYDDVNGTFTCGNLIKSITPTGDYAEYVFEYTGDETRVALLINNAYIDDFTYTPYVAVGEIAAPTSLAASNPQPTSIDLSWTAGGSETIWQFSYGTTSGSLDHKSGYVTTNPYTLTGLTPNTTYYVSVRALNDVFSVWSDETSFTTAGDIAVTGVSVSPTSWEMIAGATKTLTATISPANATYQDVSWESANTAVATVSSSGIVTAVAPGSATITVKSVADNTKIATCEITVTAPITPTDLKTKDLTSDYTYLTWSNGSSETAWQIKYGMTSGSLNNTSGDITSSKKPYLITGLSSNTTYYASIRSKLGTAYSEWSDELIFKTPTVGSACGGAIETVEDFNSGWTANNSNNVTAVKTGWGFISGVNNHTLNSTYRNGDSGYGLSGGYNSSQYIVTPAVLSGSTISFYACKSNISASQGSIYVKFFKAIKVGSNYYVDESVCYANESPTVTTMSKYTSSAITEGGYVAIQLYNAAVDDITYQASSTVSAITDNYGFTTFASSSLLDLTTANLPSGLEAYVAKVDGSKVKFTEINQAVPANTGILLKGAPYTEYKIAIANTSNDVLGNDFLVNSSGYAFTAESGYTYYGMLKNSNPLTFGVFDPSTVAIPSNKAYLKVANTPTGEARVLTCSFFDETTTGIMETRTESIDRLTTTKVFNLAGQQIANPTKGLYIINGKKHIIK